MAVKFFSAPITGIVAIRTRYYESDLTTLSSTTSNIPMIYFLMYGLTDCINIISLVIECGY